MTGGRMGRAAPTFSWLTVVVTVVVVSAIQPPTTAGEFVPWFFTLVAIAGLLSAVEIALSKWSKS